MGSLKIGVMINSFRLGVKDGIRKAAEIGADGFQIFTTTGEMAPENLDETSRKDFVHFVESLGLTVSALCADFGGHGLELANDNDWKVPKMTQVMDLAVDLNTSVVTTHIGVIPDNTEDPRWQVMHEACAELGRHGEKVGVRLAIETGPEPVHVLKTFCDSFDSGSVCVNYDPANLAMVTGEDPVAGVHALADHIVHTHAKDGVQLKAIAPKVVYDHFAEGGITDLRLGDYFEEKPLGEGDVPFDAYVQALRDVGYNGFFTIEREVGTDPVADIVKAKTFLDRY